MSDREEFEKRLQVPEDAIWSEKEREAWAIGMNTRPPSAGVPDEWRDVVARTVQALSIMDESEGIAGWHLNGDVSPWDEGDLLALRDELTALLATPQPEGDGWIRCSERLPAEANADCFNQVWLTDVSGDGVQMEPGKWIGRLSQVGRVTGKPPASSAHNHRRGGEGDE